MSLTLDSSIFNQWLGRITFALVIAIVLHWWQRVPGTGTYNSIGKRLRDDDDSLQGESTNLLRSKMLDKIGKTKVEKNDNKQHLDHDEKKERRDNAEEDNVLIDDDNISQDESPSKVVLSKQIGGLDPTRVGVDTMQGSSISSEQVNDQIQEIVVADGNTAISAHPSVQQRPRIRAKNGSHPGPDGFKNWYEVQVSLYRIYTIGRTDGTLVHPPFIPKSERGHVPLRLRVTNNYRQTISVYWVNFGGNEVHKRDVKHGSDFFQTTWIGHPWVFREKDTNNLLCYYIPYRVIPNTHEVPTVDFDEPDEGLHRFTIVSLGRQLLEDEGAICHIHDPVFPTIIRTPQDAVTWTFQELSRMNYSCIDILTKYLKNVVMHPEETKYRQIRIANRRFKDEIWLTPARGLLLAAGFLEQGSHAELGSSSTLPRDRVQDISLLLFHIEKWKKMHEQQASVNVQQPKGADGYGRANFGRPGLK